eukprot:3817290-Amphidinium_carterae.1
MVHLEGLGGLSAGQTSAQSNPTSSLYCRVSNSRLNAVTVTFSISQPINRRRSWEGDTSSVSCAVTSSPPLQGLKLHNLVNKHRDFITNSRYLTSPRSPAHPRPNAYAKNCKKKTS